MLNSMIGKVKLHPIHDVVLDFCSIDWDFLIMYIRQDHGPFHGFHFLHIDSIIKKPLSDPC